MSIAQLEIMTTDTTGLLIKRTDEGLYASKAAGRNCVHFHDGHQCRPASAMAAPADTTGVSQAGEATPASARSETNATPANPSPRR